MSGTVWTCWKKKDNCSYFLRGNKLKFIRAYSKKIAPYFAKSGRLHIFYPLYEVLDSFFLTPGETTHKGPHIRDGIDSKRFMITVVIALIPAIFVGMYNIGYQSYLARGIEGSWTELMWFGFLTMLPVIIVTYAVGLFWELVFAIIRKHEMNEVFFVLILPPTIPLWQVAVAITFGVIIGKEVFGGTGMNVFNPALISRAFLFFTYPGKISGDKVWTAIDYAKDKLIDGFSGATPLLVASSAERGSSASQAVESAGFTFQKLFYGLIPGSMGETSTAAILIGAFILIATGVGSWRIMAAVFAGGAGTAWLFNILAGGDAPAIFTLPPTWHLVMGGFAFGAVFMATDPVSAASTNIGKWIYGILIGVMAILIRTVNPAYPEGMMLAILFMNVFAPLIDYYVVRANIQRRLKRA
jgi:Na+-transporting NADH:ubiquinone oxidoreductase subunit B